MSAFFAAVWPILVAVLVLCLLVVVHEAGHFLTGRLLGFKILEFSVGLGPKIVSFVRKGIRYSLRLIPLGGYCKFYGEDEENPGEGAFNTMPIWKRAIVLISGSASNVLFAFLIGILLLTTVGDFGLAVESVNPGSYAEQAGLQAEDYFYAVDGEVVGVDADVISMIAAAPERFELVVVRDGERVPVTVRKDAENHIGVMTKVGHYRMNLWQASGRMGAYFVAVTKAVWGFIGRLVTFRFHADEVSGPITTIALIGQVSRAGIEWLAYITILIAINLGIFNLLPFPALDGGRVLLLAVEAIRRKPLPRDKEALVHFIGLVVLIGFVIFVEIANWIGRAG